MKRGRVTAGFASLLRLADAAQRDRYVDLLRALAITAVVLGHWLVTVISYDQRGRPVGRSALEDLGWAHPVTWLVQVMPVFFLVGGYANAASLRSRWRHGADFVDWLHGRSGRLLRPTTTLVLVLVAAAVVARWLGAPPDQIRTVVWFCTVPLWFLAAYLAVVLLTPVTYALHRRYGAAVPAVLLIGVAAGDLARLADRDALDSGSFLFGWLAMHQAGYAWRDRCAGPQPPDPPRRHGRAAAPRRVARMWLPATRRGALALLTGGLAALLALTLLGPYPISMINVPGERLHNMSPPSLALLSLATAQLGLILALADPARRWLTRRRPWRVVAAINSVVLTIFLWHIAAAVLLIGLLDALGLLPTPTVGSVTWLLWRLPWLLMLAVVLAVLVAIFARVEWHGASRTRRPPRIVTRVLARPVARTGLTMAAFTAVVLGLLGNSTAPRDASVPLGIPTAALAGYLAGAALLRLLRAVQSAK